MLPEGFEPPFPTIKRPQTHLLHHTATGISCYNEIKRTNCVLLINICTFIFRAVTLQPNSGLGRLIFEASASHTDMYSR